MLLEVKNLQKTYKSRGIETYAIKGIDLSIEKGEFLGVMGPSGAGKTTFLNLISTIDKATSGEIVFCGREIQKLNGKALADFRRKNIGFLFQDYNLLNHLNIMDNIALPLTLTGENHQEIIKRVKELATFFGISQQLQKYPYELSGGQKQRAAAARAVITKPSIVLADEPTGALDSKSATEMLSYLSLLNRELKITILMVTHDALSASYSNNVIFLKDGKVHSKLSRLADRKEFYSRILDHLAFIGGVKNEHA